LFVTVVGGNVFRQLDAGVEASGPHDFAVRVSTFRQSVLPASTASRPALMTLRNAPLWDGTARLSEPIWVGREAEYFCKGGLDWANHVDPVQEIGVLAQGPQRPYWSVDADQLAAGDHQH
jgi:hypothetical protein